MQFAPQPQVRTHLRRRSLRLMARMAAFYAQLLLSAVDPGLTRIQGNEPVESGGNEIEGSWANDIGG